MANHLVILLTSLLSRLNSTRSSLGTFVVELKLVFVFRYTIGGSVHVQWGKQCSQIRKGVNVCGLYDLGFKAKRHDAIRF